MISSSPSTSPPAIPTSSPCPRHPPPLPPRYPLVILSPLPAPSHERHGSTDNHQQIGTQDGGRWSGRAFVGQSRSAHRHRPGSGCFGAVLPREAERSQRGVSEWDSFHVLSSLALSASRILDGSILPRLLSHPRRAFTQPFPFLFFPLHHPFAPPRLDPPPSHPRPIVRPHPRLSMRVVRGGSQRTLLRRGHLACSPVPADTCSAAAFLCYRLSGCAAPCRTGIRRGSSRTGATSARMPTAPCASTRPSSSRGATGSAYTLSAERPASPMKPASRSQRRLPCAALTTAADSLPHVRCRGSWVKGAAGGGEGRESQKGAEVS